MAISGALWVAIRGVKVNLCEFLAHKVEKISATKLFNLSIEFIFFKNIANIARKAVDVAQ